MIRILIVSTLLGLLGQTVVAKNLEYEMSPGERLADVLLRLNLDPIWGPNGYFHRTVIINKGVMRPDGTVKQKSRVQLPIQTLKKSRIAFVTQDGLIQFGTDTNANGNSKVTIRVGCSSAEQDRVSVWLRSILESGKNVDINVESTCEQPYAGNTNVPAPSYSQNQPDTQTQPTHSNNTSTPHRPPVAQKPFVKKNEKTEVIQVEDKKFEISPWTMSFNTPKRNPNSAISAKQGPPKKNFFFPSIGVAFDRYEQGIAFAHDLTSLTVGIRYRNLLLPPHWHVDANLDFTAVNISNTADTSVRFLDFDLRAGYAFPFVSEPWRFMLMAGAYSTMMMVDSGAFGYGFAIYPQIYPELRRILPSGDSLAIFFKFVSTGGDVFSFDQDRALSTGIRWDRPSLMFGLPFHLGLDWSSLDYTSPEGVRVKRESTTIKMGVAF